ncbi:MAG TPA: hypothetical protein VFM36_07910, partial [Thermoanaerobaculia bacterium]|nr:hypothetical protein [Thermoanaerobaculia bacterium]
MMLERGSRNGLRQLAAALAGRSLLRPSGEGHYETKVRRSKMQNAKLTSAAMRHFFILHFAFCISTFHQSVTRGSKLPRA